MKSKVTTAPSIEPVTLEEVKAHLRITATNEDGLLNTYIQAARELAEDITGRKFITQTLTGYVDDFGGGGIHGNWWTGQREGTYFSHILNGKGFIELDKTPASSITQIDTVDRDNAETVYASTNYYLENYDNDMPARVHLNDNASIPSNIRDRNGIKVTYVAGYGSTRTSVPMKLRHAIKMMAAELYNKRGDCDDCAMSSGQLPILTSYKIERV